MKSKAAVSTCSAGGGAARNAGKLALNAPLSRRSSNIAVR
jgi:hypothetical protein